MITKKLFFDANIFNDIYHITSRHTSKSVALTSLNSLNDLVNIVPFAEEELSNTLVLMQRDSDYNDMKDTIQYIPARQEKCDLIITNDKKFTSKNIEICSSKEFCKKNNIGY